MTFLRSKLKFNDRVTYSTGEIFTEYSGALTDHSKNQGVVIVFPARKSEVCSKKENLRKLFTKDRESVLAVKKIF